ncbi:MAG: hypothetical protein ACK53Y_01130, partial [bacterium]
MCIALYPASNAAGSWILWKIETRTRVRRSNVRKMVTTDIIIQAMNSTAKESQSDEPEEVEEVGRQQPAEDVPIREEITEVTLETPAGNLEESQPLEEVAAKEDGVEEE